MARFNARILAVTAWRRIERFITAFTREDGSVGSFVESAKLGPGFHTALRKWGLFQSIFDATSGKSKNLI
jgi:hypothetical protein